ncbi:major facilitator superfamily MFS_1 [Nitrosococcus halophilus Nc 4]|uniref:Major facilitator superfamily MFS_1 n=1 Tax=Nitrosococcus halophilus (strain Nc4) TaxID=472759 RepID=D5C3A5_NITHN|nr:AmpG family muropeptide MFS transporter [Nitrosococcus halophilus]ADE16812.1 major facilitator superfamily MFS_1 [Nitrosococcus halophilus Nc 4]
MIKTRQEYLRVIFSGRMLVVFLMGFSSGLPLLLTGSVLQAWMQEEGVDLGTIGLFALVGLPYTLKFLWAPFLDRYSLGRMGRRRGWLLRVQVGLILALIGLGLTEPAISPLSVAGAALLVTFFSATQDIVIDAYRRESLADHELGLGSSFYVNGYRLGMLLASGGGLILADYLPFPQVYQLLALVMLSGVFTTLLAPEPGTSANLPKTLREAVIAPFLEYFRRPDAFLILLFILLYKIGDTMASHMTIPFYLDLGYSKTEIGALVKGFGFWATIVGGLIGGGVMLRLGIYRALWAFGLLQGISTAGFAVLGIYGYSLLGLAAVIVFENLSGGMGTAAYMAFMASLTNRKFTATQYALLSSLMGIPRVIVAAPTGFFAESFGWVPFFSCCALIAIPGLLLLRRFQSWL